MRASIATLVSCALTLALPLNAEMAEDDEFGFLDYLGTMVEVEGEWIDAVTLANETATQSTSEPDDLEQETKGVAPGDDDDE